MSLLFKIFKYIYCYFWQIFCTLDFVYCMSLVLFISFANGGSTYYFHYNSFRTLIDTIKPFGLLSVGLSMNIVNDTGSNPIDFVLASLTYDVA